MRTDFMPFIQIDDAIVNFRLRRSHRAKRLQMSVRQQQFEIVAPTRIRNAEILQFVFAHQRWLKKQSKQFAKHKPTPQIWPEAFLPGEALPFRDTHLQLHIEYGRKGIPVQQGNTLIVSVPWEKTPSPEMAKNIKQQVLKWYQQQALAAIQKSIEHFCPKLGRWPNGYALKQQKTRWGSCGITNKIYLNWLLILAPVGVLEYVVAHELCHLFHRNHGKRFWAKVAFLFPEYEQHERWLRQHGQRLLPLK
jgi:predicted metal-dependent hydrolase